MVNAKSHREESGLRAPEKILIYHGPLSSGSIYSSEAREGVAYRDQQPNQRMFMFVFKNETSPSWETKKKCMTKQTHSTSVE